MMLTNGNLSKKIKRISIVREIQDHLFSLQANFLYKRKIINEESTMQTGIFKNYH